MNNQTIARNYPIDGDLALIRCPAFAYMGEKLMRKYLGVKIMSVNNNGTMKVRDRRGLLRYCHESDVLRLRVKS